MCAAVKRSLPHVWSCEYGSFRNRHYQFTQSGCHFFVYCRTSSPYRLSAIMHRGWWGESHCATFHFLSERTIYPSERIHRWRKKTFVFSNWKGDCKRIKQKNHSYSHCCREKIAKINLWFVPFSTSSVLLLIISIFGCRLSYDFHNLFSSFSKHVEILEDASIAWIRLNFVS